MLDLQALIRECDAELREYYDFLSEQIEAVQEFTVTVIRLGLFAYSKELTKAQVRPTAKKQTFVQKEKPFTSTAGFTIDIWLIICLCAFFNSVGQAANGCLLWGMRTPFAPCFLSASVPR